MLEGLFTGLFVASVLAIAWFVGLVVSRLVRR